MESKLSFDWDGANIKHLARHAVTRTEFEQVMSSDPILFDYESLDGEDRWAGLGATSGLRVLIVIFTIRDSRIRAVTAFDADKKRVREFWKRKGI
jgi:uncharacterized DUF497 family protein